MQNQKHIDHTIAFINNKIHKYTIIWRKTQRTLLIVEERITTQLSAPASSSQHQSLLTSLNSKITPTIQFSFLKYKLSALPCNSQYSSLQISQMRDPFIDVCKSVSHLQGFDQCHSTCYNWFHSEISQISYSSLGKFREASVIGEVSRRFHEQPPSKLSRTFFHPHPSHPIEGLISMHRTLVVYPSVCIVLFEWSSQYGSVQEISGRFLRGTFGE